MKSKWHKTKYPGVRFRQHPTRKYRGKPDCYFVIRYTLNGKQYEEPVGWSHDNWNAIQASQELAALKKNQRRGERWRTLKEKRELRDQKEEAEKLKREQEKRNRKTFAEIFQLYINQTKSDGKKSWNREASLGKKWILPVLGEIPLRDISPILLEKIKKRMRDKGKAPRTVQYALSTLRQTFHFAIKRGLFHGESPTKRIVWPRFDNRVTEDLRPEQLTKLLEVIDKYQDSNINAANMMRMALFTGLRRSELFGLTWRDLDFDKNFIHIRDAKSGRDEVIPLNELARGVLQNHPKTDSPFVFPGRDGKQLTTNPKAINKIRQKAKLPEDFRPLHGLRHVFASGLASSGKVDLYTLQKLLTHKSPQMTMRYSHLRDEALKRASNVAAEIFQPKKKQDQAEQEPASKVLPIKE